MEGNGEESNDDIRQSEVGNEEVGDRLKLVFFVIFVILINVLCNIKNLLIRNKILLLGWHRIMHWRKLIN